MGLEIPGQLKVDITNVSGPNAHPVSLPVQGPAGMKLFIVGGMSKAELAAAEIMAKLVEVPMTESDMRRFAKIATDAAVALVQEFERRAQDAQKESRSAQADHRNASQRETAGLVAHGG